MNTNDEVTSANATPTTQAGAQETAEENVQAATTPTMNPDPTKAETASASGGEADKPKKTSAHWGAGLDFGLLILRVAVGGTALLHGLQKLGVFGDSLSIDIFAAGLEAGGYEQATLLSWVTALTEVAAGGALLIGLATPLAAAGVLGVMISATYNEREIGYFPDFLETGGLLPGYNYPLLLGAAALALLFTGAGRISVDVAAPWRRKPVLYGLAGLALAAGASILVITVFGP